MEENFKAISQALSQAGLKDSAENKTGKPVDFKITPYSLNTKLSFRFKNLNEFTEFISLSDTETAEEKKELIRTAFLELGLNPKEFFYVNFFERGKEAEM
jgi:hypothetical protein